MLRENMFLFCGAAGVGKEVAMSEKLYRVADRDALERLRASGARLLHRSIGGVHKICINNTELPGLPVRTPRRESTMDRFRLLSLASIALASLATVACVEPGDPTTTAADRAVLGAVAPESFTVGTSVHLAAYAGETKFTLPKTKGMVEIVGMAVAANNDHIYTWFADGTVSSGYSQQLDLYTPPVPFVLPATLEATDIIGVGINSAGRVYAWYRNSTVSLGSSTNLADSPPQPFTLPPGMTPADVVGLDIASDDRVYAWYKNGTVSIGTSTNLDAYLPPSPFALPAGQKIGHIVEMAISGDDQVYSFFQDLEHGVAWPAIANAVDPIIVDRLRALRIAGATVAISKDGKIVFDRAYGLSQRRYPGGPYAVASQPDRQRQQGAHGARPRPLRREVTVVLARNECLRRDGRTERLELFQRSQPRDPAPQAAGRLRDRVERPGL
jgi:hypothetical protein